MRAVYTVAENCPVCLSIWGEQVKFVHNNQKDYIIIDLYIKFNYILLKYVNIQL